MIEEAKSLQKFTCCSSVEVRARKNNNSKVMGLNSLLHLGKSKSEVSLDEVGLYLNSKLRYPGAKQAYISIDRKNKSVYHRILPFEPKSHQFTCTELKQAKLEKGNQRNASLARQFVSGHAVQASKDLLAPHLRRPQGQVQDRAGGRQRRRRVPAGR